MDVDFFLDLNTVALTCDPNSYQLKLLIGVIYVIDKW